MALPKNPLTDLLSPKARQVVYALLFVAALVYAAAQANGGDWRAAIASVLVSLFGGALPASNVKAKPVKVQHVNGGYVAEHLRKKG